jgi:hypothetical protein
MADNPYVARLEGHIFVRDPHHKVSDHWEIIRIFCFQGIQPNGHDWITFDALQKEAPSKSLKSGLKIEEDGTAHGDPP